VLGTAYAQESRTDREIDERFAAADKNKDGKLTLEEAKAGMPRVAANFQRIDTQKKGYVTAAEIKAMADR
jgi:Ca2+-binding EF-hand superfamily protein